MKEDFLHYVWKFQKFDGINFYTSNREKLHIKSQGSHNRDSGPDFFNAQISIDGQVWAGNVEIHIKSSDWYAHGHHTDPAYNNVILHVVWENDTEIYRKDGTVIPAFIIAEQVSKNTLAQYRRLFSKQKKWINCENDFAKVSTFTLDNWLERLYFERLERKNAVFQKELDASKNHWESLLFRMLCKNFGLKVNGASFLSIGKSLDFAIVSKSSHEPQNLEALLLGQAGLLDGDSTDWYARKLREIYAFTQHKYSLSRKGVIAPKFFRLRPPNFPTLRLAQLAALYGGQNNLFSQVIAIDNTADFYELFDVSASEYWDTHYNFEASSLKRKKKITKKFIDLLIINTLLPLKFCYARQHGKDNFDEIIEIASAIPSEENNIIRKFNRLREVSKNVLQSQALLELKNRYCDLNKCLQCAVGNTILGNRKNYTENSIAPS